MLFYCLECDSTFISAVNGCPHCGKLDFDVADDPAPAAPAPLAETIVEPIARHVGRYLVPAIVLPALLPTQASARPGGKIRLRLPDVRNGPFGVVQTLLMLTVLPAAGALLPILFLW